MVSALNVEGGITRGRDSLGLGFRSSFFLVLDLNSLHYFHFSLFYFIKKLASFIIVGNSFANRNYLKYVKISMHTM